MLPMRIGGHIMDLLKIRDKEAYFSLGAEDEKLVSMVTTEDIRKALELLLADSNVDIGANLAAEEIANPAQRIFFTQLRSSFTEVLGSRDSIKSDIDELFSQAEALYLKKDDAGQH